MTVTTLVSANNDFQLSKANVNQSSLLMTKVKGADLISSSFTCLNTCFAQYVGCAGGNIILPPYHPCQEALNECTAACGY
jgi:hypothetical protein